MGLSSTIARIGFGILVDKYRSSLFFMMSAVLFINGINIFLSSFLGGFSGQVFTAAMFGSGLGAYVTSLLVLVSTIVEDITFPMSICVATIGVATLVGPTSVGILLDTYQSFLPGFMSSGILLMVGALCLPWVWCNIPRERKLLIV